MRIIYLHLGQGTVVNYNTVVGIFDMDTSTVSKFTRNFLNKAEKNGEVITITYELPKSFVLCKGKNERKRKIFLSQISSSTLVKRSGFIDNL